jgi:predicted amidohydrolase YtcJ
MQHSNQSYGYADLVLINAKILTLNKSLTNAEAVAIQNGKIVKVCSNAEVTGLAGKNTKVIDLQGKTVVPGFIDAHIHVADLGRFLTWLDLKNVTSIEELQGLLKERAQKISVGKWILGRGWDETCFKEARLPAISDLDSVTPNNPVLLYHQSAMMCVVNSKALELAHVAKASSVSGVAKDLKTGEPTGILRNGATDLVWKIAPELSEEELLDATAFACQKIVEAGVTSIHWMVISANEISLIEKLYSQKKLPLRVYVTVPAEFLEQKTNFKPNGNSVLRVGGALFTVDGYLASETAALLQPYIDYPLSSGDLLYTQRQLDMAVSKAIEAGLQPVFHAMGDKAVDLALTAIEHATESKKQVSCQIEHAALLNEGLVERLKKQKVIVSVQPLVAASEYLVWSTAEHLGPQRARWLYPLKTLLEQDICLIGGSDGPMEPINPLLGIQYAATRNSFPDERITVEQALRMYALDAAYSSGEEGVKGSIEVNKLADLTVLSDDPLTVPKDKISDIKVELTIIGGKIVYSSPRLHL